MEALLRSGGGGGRMLRTRRACPGVRQAGDAGCAGRCLWRRWSCSHLGSGTSFLLLGSWRWWRRWWYLKLTQQQQRRRLLLLRQLMWWRLPRGCLSREPQTLALCCCCRRFPWMGRQLWWRGVGAARLLPQRRPGCPTARGLVVFGRTDRMCQCA